MDIWSYPFRGQYEGLTSFFSREYWLLFLPMSVLIYWISPKKSKKYVLLLLSYLFFALISGKLIVYLWLSTLSVWGFGKVIDRIYNQRDALLKTAEKGSKKEIKQKYLKKAKVVLGAAVCLHIGLLLTLKYSAFFAVNVNSLLHAIGMNVSLEVPKFIMPIGISFFTLQAVSYLIDVFRESIQADHNLGRLALYLSFFPQIVEGPICRYAQTAEQLWNVKRIEFKNFSSGMQRFLYGMMKKIVIADRLNPFIKMVFENYQDYTGLMIAVAAVFYTIQLYMDFSGAMDAVIGIGQIFGIVMPENFKRPFFSKNISEFWTRWHISLGLWFKDYIFYPVSMSKSMKSLTSKARKKYGNYYGPLVAGSIALFCVWFSNGLWHGAAWSYIFFGMYHFTWILLGNITAPISKQLLAKLKISGDNNFYSLFRIVKTGIIVVIGELFFRADGLKKGIAMFIKIFTDFTMPVLNDGFLGDFRLSILDLAILALAILVVFVISVFEEKGIEVQKVLQNQKFVVRWSVCYALIIMIIIFGAYGEGYIQVDPIYANF